MFCMLKIISSKSENLIYQEISKVKKKFGFAVTTQNVSLLEAMGRVNDISIFGDKEVFWVNFKTEEQDMLERDIKLGNIDLKVFEESVNLYFFVGSGAEFEKFFADILARFHLAKNCDVVKLEEKKVFDFPADLVNALQKGDKKNAWNLLVKELKEKDAEPVHGTCVFAYKTLLVYLNDTKQNSKDSGVKDFSWNNAKRNTVVGKRNLQEVQDKYFSLIEIYHKARVGEGDLAKQLEIWVLQ